jgi:hypothetical protein
MNKLTSTQLFTSLYESRNDKKSEYYIEEEDFEIVPTKGLKFGMKKRGVHYFGHFIRNLSATKKNLIINDNDTFVIGFPKSGTTWVSLILWLISSIF